MPALGRDVIVVGAPGPPLQGLSVLEVAELLPGPYCCFLLRGLGARVVRVERPEGDPARRLIPALHDAVNAGKQSVRLDLASAAGRDALRGLLAEVDAAVVGHRPSTIRKLGLDAATLRGLRPDLVWAAVTGYGLTGPYADLPGHDINYQAAGGSLRPADDRPPHLPVADILGATSAALAICAALVARARTGRGATLDLSLCDAAAGLASVRAVLPVQARRGGYGVFRCADGHALALGCIEEHFFENLFRALEPQGLAVLPAWRSAEGRRADAVSLDAALQDVFARRDRDAWLVGLAEEDVPVSPVHAPAEQAEDPHLLGRGFGGCLAPPFARPGLAPG